MTIRRRQYVRNGEKEMKKISNEKNGISQRENALNEKR